MNELEKKTGMTEEEADYWDEYYTKNPPKVDPARNRIKIEPLTACEAAHKEPSEVIGEMVREKIAVSA